MDQIHKTRVLEMPWRQVEQRFSSFFGKLSAYLMFFKVDRTEGTAKPFENSSNIIKKLQKKTQENPCSTCLKPIY